MFPPGRYRLSNQVSVVDKPVMLVGIQALNGYQQETGLEPLSEVGRDTLGHSDISAGFLRTLALRRQHSLVSASPTSRLPTSVDDHRQPHLRVAIA